MRYRAGQCERSVGYRKGKPGARQCSYQLGRELNGGTYRWIVEADIARLTRVARPSGFLLRRQSVSLRSALGFDFYWSRTRRNPNHKVVKRKTNKKKYRASLRAMKDWIRKARSLPLRAILSSLRNRLRGYWNYYCVTGNSRLTWKYYREATRIVFKWLNRRSQRKVSVNKSTSR